MANVSISMTNGDIRFIPKVDPTPATSETTGNVTINNSGSLGRPAHFEASFKISASITEGDLRSENSFYWYVPVQNENDDAPYRTIEAEAARQIAPMLRAVADQIGRAVAEFEEKERAEKPSA